MNGRLKRRPLERRQLFSALGQRFGAVFCGGVLCGGLSSGKRRQFEHGRSFGVMLQLNIHGQKGAGEAGVRADAAAIVAHFPADLELTNAATKVRITARPEARDMIVADASVFIPVMIRWECFA